MLLTERLTSSRLVAGLALVAALTILAAMVGAGALYLRRHLREHLVQRDGEILYTVALARQYANGAGEALRKRLGNPADQLALALEISQLREGTLGVRLFDAEGRFVTAFPPNVVATNLSSGVLLALKGLQPVSQFHDQVHLGDYFWLNPGDAKAKVSSSVLETTIPLHARDEPKLLAAAQLLLDGHALARAYTRMDEHLRRLAVGLYAGGALLLSGVLIWAYRRLRRAHALVEERTARLLRANHELALAAKTNAVGAVTAHLIHGLSNPLANLQDFIASHGGKARAEEWQDAAAAARRMQQLVQEVVRVLGETRGGERYELSLLELVDVLKSKMHPAVCETGVNLITETEAAGQLSNHHANLILLILENLIHNALKVTPRSRSVRVRFAAESGYVRCEVEDEGPGIPAEVLPRLFAPCHSTQGGSGLGLAISRQLAQQLGAKLELKVNTRHGCLFTLTLPRTVFAEEQADLRQLDPLDSAVATP